MFGLIFVTVRAARRSVLDKWDSVAHDPAVSGQQPGYEVRRGGSRELAEVAVQMRLVGVAAVVGEVGPAGWGTLDTPAHAAEADQTRHGLGRETDLLAEAG